MNLRTDEISKKGEKTKHLILIFALLANAYEIENDIVFQHCLQLGIVDSFISKSVTIDQLCQKVRDEFLVYQLAINLK